MCFDKAAFYRCSEKPDLKQHPSCRGCQGRPGGLHRQQCAKNCTLPWHDPPVYGHGAREEGEREEGTEMETIGSLSLFTCTAVRRGHENFGTPGENVQRDSLGVQQIKSSLQSPELHFCLRSLLGAGAHLHISIPTLRNKCLLGGGGCSFHVREQSCVGARPVRVRNGVCGWRSTLAILCQPLSAI